MILDYMDGQRFHGDEDDFDYDGTTARESCAFSDVCEHALLAAGLSEAEADEALTDGRACYRCDYWRRMGEL